MTSTNSPTQVQAIKFVLWAQDMDRAVAFYTSVIGLAERFTSPGWSELGLGDAIVALHGGGDGSVNTTGLSIQVQDLGTACERVATGGGSVIDPPMSREGEPIRLANVQDTEGNRFMLTQYVG